MGTHLDTISKHIAGRYEPLHSSSAQSSFPRIPN
jgi:hypothetical protein